MTLYTINELADILHTSKRTIRNYIQRGELKASLIGRNYFIQESDLQDFLNNNKGKLKTGAKEQESNG